jgi:ABC-2 type transport system permease protein
LNLVGRRRAAAPTPDEHPDPNLNQGDLMTTVTSTVTLDTSTVVRPRPRTGGLAAVATLARRRLAISARTPRELLIPLLAPLLFALVVVPALADTFGTSIGGVDYMTFVAVATIGLLVPLSTIQSGLGVVVDRLGGGLRDLLAAPVSRPSIVAGNLVVAVALASLQVAVLLGAAAVRGAEYDLSATGVMWFAAATLGFAVAMYGAAEVLANRLPTQEEYIAALPAVAIVPFFFAGSFFPISALPAGLTVIGKLLPITHVLALVRYGLADRNGAGLHDIWGMSNTTAMAALSLGVVALFAVALMAAAVRTFQRTAVR